MVATKSRARKLSRLSQATINLNANPPHAKPLKFKLAQEMGVTSDQQATFKPMQISPLNLIESSSREIAPTWPNISAALDQVCRVCRGGVLLLLLLLLLLRTNARQASATCQVRPKLGSPVQVNRPHGSRAPSSSFEQPFPRARNSD